MSSILITGGGCPGWFSVFQILKPWAKHRGFSTVACDKSCQTAGYIEADNSFIVSAGGETGYKDEIQKAVEKYDIQIIIPLTDPELLPLAELAPLLNNCHVMVSPPEVLSVVLDKQRLYRSLPSIAPVHAECTTANDVKRFLGQQSDNQSCFVKLVTAHGSRGTKRVVLDNVWHQAFSTHKPGAFGSLFPLSQLPSILQQYKLLVAEMLPGNEYSVDCVFSTEGRLCFYTVREREQTRDGICSIARFCIDNTDEFGDIVRYIAERIPLRYCVNIQLKRNYAGLLKILEINPRIPGSIQSYPGGKYNHIIGSLDLLMGACPADCFPELTPRGYSCSRTFRVSFFKGEK